VQLLISTTTALGDPSTNQPTSTNTGDLPRPFDGLIATNPTGVIPVAVYVCRSNFNSFISVGTVFCDGPHSYSVIVPEHIFTMGETASYRIRIVHPINSKSHRENGGYIDHIVSTSKDNYGKDIVQATLGPNPREIVGFSRLSAKENISMYPTNEVSLGGQSVTSIHSVITGEEALIMGYGMTTHDGTTNRLLMVESCNAPGYSGTPFYDDHHTIFILNGSLEPDDPTVMALDKEFMRCYRRHIKGIAFLVGPIILSPAN